MRSPPTRFWLLKRLAIAGVVCIAGLGAAWYWGRLPLARWAVGKALHAAGMEPAAFQVTDASLDGVRVANLKVGATPWLEAGDVIVKFDLGSLLHKRVQTIRLSDVHWRVKVKDGQIDWGYAGSGSGSAISLAMPFDELALTRTTIHAEIDGVGRDIEISGDITPRDGALAATFDVAGLGNKTSLLAHVSTKDTKLEVAASGEVNVPVAPTTTPAPTGSALGAWNMNLSRDLNTGAMQIDGEARVGELLKHFAGDSFHVDRADLDVHVTMPAQGAMNARANLALLKMSMSGIAIDEGRLSATKSKDGEVALAMNAAGNGWNVPAASGFVTWNPQETNASKTYQISMKSEKAVVIDLEEQGVTGGIAAAEGRAHIGYDGDRFSVLDGDFSFEGGAAIAGDLAVSNAHGAAHLAGTESIDIRELSAEVGDGSTVTFDPFTWTIEKKELASRVALTNFSLEHWLPILTSKHATGEGRMSGDVAFSLVWPDGTLKLGELKGSLRADPEHGFIQATDADAVGDLLEKQDPRFATDPVMQPIRDKIVSALGDFAFKKLTVDLSRTGDRTVALTYLSGFGRHGEDPQGLNLTLDLHVQDSVVDMASKLKEKSDVTKAAREALEKFFQKPAAEEKR